MMQRIRAKSSHASCAVELGLHICINLLTYCALISILQRSRFLAASEIYSGYGLTTVGGVMCCSMLRAGSRISSWIGFSLLSQLSFLALLLLDESDSYVQTIVSGIFVIHLALHITTCSWKDDAFHDIAVTAFHFRLIGAPFVPWSTVNIVLIVALFVVVHGLKGWKSSNILPLQPSIMGYVYIAARAGLEIFLWLSILSASWLSPHALVTLGFALCLRWCRLDLSAPELLVVFAFVHLAMCCLWDVLVALSSGDHGSIVALSASSYAVLAVSGVGVLGILFFGERLVYLQRSCKKGSVVMILLLYLAISVADDDVAVPMLHTACAMYAGVVAAMGISGMLHFRVAQSSNTPVAAVCFTSLLVGVIVGFILPGMTRAVALYWPTPPQHAALPLPLPLPLVWVMSFLTNSPYITPSYGDLDSESERQPQQHFFGLPLRVGISLYWIFALVTFLPISEYLCQRYSRHIPQIASRTLFHFLSVAMFTPIIHLDAEMMFLSFSVALCALLLIEYIR